MDMHTVEIDLLKIYKEVNAKVRPPIAVTCYNVARDVAKTLEAQTPQYQGLNTLLANAKIFSIGRTAYLTAMTQIMADVEKAAELYRKELVHYKAAILEAIESGEDEQKEYWMQRVSRFWVDLYGYQNVPFTMFAGDSGQKTFELSYQLPLLPFPSVFVALSDRNMDGNVFFGTPCIQELDLPGHDVFLYGVLLNERKAYYFAWIINQNAINDQDIVDPKVYDAPCKMLVFTFDHYPDNFDAPFYQKLFDRLVDKDVRKSWVTPAINNALDLFLRETTSQHGMTPSARHKVSKIDARQYRKHGVMYVPPEYYSIDVTPETVRHTAQRMYQSIAERHLHYRHDRRAHYKLKMFRGTLPMSHEQYERFHRLQYRVFLDEPLSKEYTKALTVRGMSLKESNEWMALKLSQVRATEVGDKSLPKRTAVRYLPTEDAPHGKPDSA